MGTFKEPWTCYLSLRLVVGLLETITDLLQSSRLFHLKEFLFGGLMLAFPFLALTIAAISVSTQPNIINNLSWFKFFRLIFLHTTEIYAGFFQSGPVLILQATIIWKGLLREDLYILFSGEQYGSTDWCFGLNAIFSICLTFISLLITSLHYNRQLEIPAAKFFSAVLTSLFTIISRVLIFSILFATMPGPAGGVVSVMYLIHLVVYKICGGSEENWNCIVYSYYSIYTPAGYARWIGSAKSAKMNGTLGNSEIERAKINQDSLLNRVKVSYLLHLSLSLCLIVAYSALTEFFIVNEKDISIFDHMKMNTIKTILHTPPTILFLLTILFMGWHFQQVKALRDGTRAWYTLSMNGEANNSSIVRQPPFNPSAPPDPPPPYQQQLLSPTPDNAPKVHPVYNPKVLPIIPTAPQSFSPKLHNLPKVLPTIPSSPHSFNNTAYIETVPDEDNIDPLVVDNHEPRPHGTYKLHEEGCVTCELFLEGTSFTSKTTGKNYKFTSSVSCTDKNCIYLVTCVNENCGKQYVGKSLQEMRKRHYGHRREIEIKSSPLGKHFADVCGYVYFQLQIIDQIKPQKGGNSEKLKQELQRREGYWQHELMTFEPWGLNTRDELNGSAIATPTKTPNRKK